MVQIHAAEDAVPVGVVALAAPERVFGLIEQAGALGGLERGRGRLGLGGYGGGAIVPLAELAGGAFEHGAQPADHAGRLLELGGLQLAGHMQHFLVKQVGLGVLDQEVAPVAAAQKALVARVQTGAGLVEGLGLLGLQRPDLHLVVGAAGHVGAAPGGLLAPVLVEGAAGDPVLVLFEQREETVQPAVEVDGLVGVGPAAELFAVVEEDGQARAVLGGVLRQVVDDLVRRLEGDHGPERLVDREEAQGRALLLGLVVAEQVVALETGGLEVGVVQDGVFHAGLGQGLGEVGLPDAAGQPGAHGLGADVVLNLAGVLANLTDLVGVRNGREDRLVVAAGDELDLAALDHGLQARDELGVVLGQPGQQVAGVVEGHVHARVPLEHVDERQVRVLVAVLNHPVPVADGLVVVDTQSQVDLVLVGEQHAWRGTRSRPRRRFTIPSGRVERTGVDGAPRAPSNRRQKAYLGSAGLVALRGDWRFLNTR
ncbi:hypothetical protein D3C72_448110 [compost metagenome]